MDWLEEELRQALERKEPPPGFADRVMRRAAAPAAFRPAPRPVFHRQRWLATAAAIAVAIGAGMSYRQHQGAVAKEQVMAAVRFAAVKVNHIQTQVREVTR